MLSRARLSLACVSTAAALLAGCSTSPMSSIGSINPFSSKVSDTDRVFLMAAGSWDRNHDNLVTCDEWKSYASELFDGADANGDGFVDATEWKRISSVDRMFDTADIGFFDMNGDGKVSREEMTTKPNPAFTLMDPAKTCQLNGAQIAGARSKTEYDVSGAPAQNGDPREAAGQQGRVANGGVGR